MRCPHGDPALAALGTEAVVSSDILPLADCVAIGCSPFEGLRTNGEVLKFAEQ